MSCSVLTDPYHFCLTLISLPCVELILIARFPPSGELVRGPIPVWPMTLMLMCWFHRSWNLDENLQQIFLQVFIVNVGIYKAMKAKTSK